MGNAKTDADYAARMLTARILYLALVMTLGIYGVMAWVQTQRGEPPQPIDPTFLYALAGIALMEMAAIPILRRSLLPPMKPATSIGDVPPIEGDAATAAVGKYMTGNIVTWALCESIAIYGLVLVFISRDMRYYPPFAVAAAVNFLFYRPSLEDLQAAVRAARG